MLTDDVTPLLRQGKIDAQADTDISNTPLVKARREKLQNLAGVRQVSIETRIEDRASAAFFSPRPTTRERPLPVLVIAATRIDQYRRATLPMKKLWMVIHIVEKLICCAPRCRRPQDDPGPSTPAAHIQLRSRLRDLANQRRRFGYRRLFILLRETDAKWLCAMHRAI